MKRFLMAACAAACLGASPAVAQTTLAFSSWIPWTHPVVSGIYVKWIEEVEKATDGRVRFHRLPQPVASPQAHLDAVRTGQIDIAFGAPAYSPKRFAAFQFTELPLLGDDAEITSVALWRTHVKYFAGKDYFEGVELLGLNTHGPGHIFTRTRHILKPADLNGLKIRTGGPIPQRIVEAWGGVVVHQPASKVYELLSTGVTDGVTFPWESVPSFRVTKLVPYATTVPGGLYSTSFFLIVAEKRWASLPEADRDAIAPLTGEGFARFAGREWDRLNAAGRKTAEAEGTKIIDAPSDVVDAIRALLPRFEAEYAEGAKSAGIDNGAEVIKYYRAQIEALRGS